MVFRLGLRLIFAVAVLSFVAGTVAVVEIGKWIPWVEEQIPQPEDFIPDDENMKYLKELMKDNTKTKEGVERCYNACTKMCGV